jgi:hypothetical protein
MARLSHTTPHCVLSAGTFPAGVWRKISALEPGCFSLTRSSAKGPHCFNASQGRKLQDERFLSPITSVYPAAAILEASTIVMLKLPCH